MRSTLTSEREPTEEGLSRAADISDDEVLAAHQWNNGGRPEPGPAGRRDRTIRGARRSQGARQADDGPRKHQAALDIRAARLGPSRHWPVRAAIHTYSTHVPPLPADSNTGVSGRCRQGGLSRLRPEVNGSPSHCENGSRGCGSSCPLGQRRYSQPDGTKNLMNMQVTGDSKAPDTTVRDERIKTLGARQVDSRGIRSQPLGRGVDLDDFVGSLRHQSNRLSSLPRTRRQGRVALDAESLTATA
jgi:hypothetical protein